ncbi:MAG: DoxX family protein [Saprospiraceae bacterium]|nr:DoxX family protein [Saprospiraceae bacterium]
MNFKRWLFPGTFSIRIDVVLLLIRIVFGFSMLSHGIRKISKLTSGESSFADPIGLGSDISLYLVVFAEFICVILIIIGLFTRLACVPIIITMLVAIFIVHGSDPFSEKEVAILYLCGFYVLYLAGPGSISLDRKLFSTKLQTI